MNLPPALARKILDMAGEPAPPISEKAFMAEVVKLAKRCGWLVYHTLNSRRSEPGYPDLTLVREKTIWIELKTDAGKTTPEQEKWLAALAAAGQTVYVFRPSDWPLIEETLR